ncbi:MAG: sugar ABC transporter ATP-binding protein [Clostridiales Family XIII bacterium]|jgi:ABC-type sugar transport system ATPase subunit|nr:sugar ABC transporter ATP-binding protein [Clostridiales Family XIII bacterium]
MLHFLRVEGLFKAYPGVQAVNDIGFTLDRKEVLALLGENGAGKSTLTKLICGTEKPDKGKIFIDDREVYFDSAFDAMKLGVNMVHQELSMVGDMSVAENIFINRQPVTRSGRIKWKELYDATRKIMGKFNLDIDPGTIVRKLPMGTQQLLEILKAVSAGAKILILDEPTSSLTIDQIDLLFDLVDTLKREGIAIIYITHKLNEVFRLADRVMVIRDGWHIHTAPVADMSVNKIVSLMVGREIKNLYGEARAIRNQNNSDGAYCFEVRGMTAKDLYSDISFGIKKGEILGVAGLIGAGRSEMALGIVGAHKRTSGSFYKDGKPISIKNPRDAIRRKIAYLTEDRKSLGLYLNYSIALNLCCNKLTAFSGPGFVDKRRLAQYASEQVRLFNIRTPSIDQKVNNLSGGNQQKCLIAAWMGVDPDILIVDEPTRGVDVGAKSEIYRIIKDYADADKSVLLISSELPELLGICDRIMVMHNGRVTGFVDKNAWSEEIIMHYATGTAEELEKADA